MQFPAGFWHENMKDCTMYFFFYELICKSNLAKFSFTKLVDFCLMYHCVLNEVSVQYDLKKNELCR